MKEDIEKDKIDVCIVWRLDRLARKTLILLELIEFFKLHNVNFISTDENVDIKTPT
jgi:DNA invertase Pin-like site-specific DNA recombinase